MNFTQLDKRQKVLAGILVGTLLLMWGVPTIWDAVFSPYNAKYAEIAALDERLEQKETAKEKLEVAEWRLKDSKRRSLPSDPSSLAYQVWLTDLAKKHEFTALSVAPKPATRNGNEPFSRTRFSITAQCQMAELCRFLFDFYRTDLLHKVTAMSIKSLDAKTDPQLEVTVDIEGLSMQGTTKREILFEEKQEQAVAKAMAKKEFSDYETLYAKNRFSRGYNGPPKPIIPPPPPTPPFDSSPYVKYVGHVEVDGIGEGWLLDMTANKSTILKPGVEFEVAGVKATVVEVTPDYFTMTVKEKIWRVDHGESLKQMREIGVDGKPLTSPTVTVPTTVTPSTPAEIKPESTTNTAPTTTGGAQSASAASAAPPTGQATGSIPAAAVEKTQTATPEKSTEAPVEKVPE